MGTFRVWLFTVLLALMATCCARVPAPRASSTAANVPHDRHQPRVTLQVSGDVDFTGPEREAILAAALALAVQTTGYMRVDVAFDLDFRDPASLLRAQEHWSLLRTEAATEFVRDVDRRMNAEILGVTVRDQRLVALVVDRLPAIDKWRHVVMHELLHAAGAEHVRDARSLMNDAVIPPVTECLHPLDARAFCDVARCDPKTLITCI